MSHDRCAYVSIVIWRLLPGTRMPSFVARDAKISIMYTNSGTKRNEIAIDWSAESKLFADICWRLLVSPFVRIPINCVIKIRRILKTLYLSKSRKINKIGNTAQPYSGCQKSDNPILDTKKELVNRHILQKKRDCTGTKQYHELIYDKRLTVGGWPNRSS